MPLTIGDVHQTNQHLTNLLVSYFQNPQNFVARRAFPAVPVQKQSDFYYTIDRGNINRDEAKKKAPGAKAAQVEHNYSTGTYACDVYAWRELIADEVRANADIPLNLDMNATQNIAHKLLLREEKDWSSSFLSGGVWSWDYDGVSTGASTNEVIQWSDTANSDPIGDIADAQSYILSQTGFEANTLVLGYPVYKALKNHPDVIDRIKYSQGNDNPAIANESTMAKLFDVERVLIMKAIETTSDEGQTNTQDFIGGKKALLCYSASSPSTTTPSAGYTFSWQGYAGGAIGEITKYRENGIDGDYIQGKTAFDHKLVSADLGAFFDAIVA